ncbi:MAG: hypothetical protein V4619_05515 [Bacteroidota bacterium]
MSLIALESLNDNYPAVNQIRKQSFQTLPNELKFADDYAAIVRFSIKQLDIDQAINMFDIIALENCCQQVLSKLGFYHDGKIIEQLWDGHSAWYNPVFHYFRHILGFNDLPKNNLNKLDQMVREDLRYLLTLIQRYETNESAIKTYLNEGTKRGEHEDKIRLDFYARCIKERDIIVKYLTFNIEKRAFEKSINDHELGGVQTQWIIELQDRPYRWWHPFANPYFDYKLINTYRHRLGNNELLINRQELEDLYVNGEVNQFYSKLAETKSPEHVFHGILSYYVAVNNLLRDRKPIFEELKRLFENELWYGFTALALPQVEGIFSDMTALLKPDKKFNSLPNKVSAVRPFYDYHESTFDYFEYILPRLRNRFLHTGNSVGNDFKILALDLLYDLDYILDVFNSLKDEQITLNNLLNSNIELYLISVEDFNRFFKLLDKLRQRAKEYPENSKLAEVLGRWDDFENGHLAESGIYDMIWSRIKFELYEKTVDLFNTLSNLTSDLPNPISLFAIKVSELRSRFDELKSIIGSDASFYKKQYEEIMATYNWLNEYRKHLVSIKPEYIKELSDIYKEEKERDRVKKMDILKPLFITDQEI